MDSLVVLFCEVKAKTFTRADNSGITHETTSNSTCNKNKTEAFKLLALRIKSSGEY